MVTAAVEHYLLKYLQPYVDGIDAKDLQLSLWSGKLELKDVKVKEDVLGLLGVEGVRVPKGLVKRICITLPSKTRILSGKISIQVDGVQLHGEHLSESSDEEALRKVRSTKLEATALRMNQLRDLHQRQQQAQEAYEQAEPGFGMRFARRLITNLSLELSDVKLAFDNQDPKACFAAAMSSLEVLSTDSSFRKFQKDEVLEDQGSSLFKVLRFDGLSLSYGQTKEELSNVVSPVRAELKVGHVPDGGMLRLEVDLGTDKATEIQMKRSHILGMLALKAALNHKWERLREKLVDPQVEAMVMIDLDASKERYFTLFRQQCLSNVDKGEVKVLAALQETGLSCAALEPEDNKELETLENVLPFQLLASARYRAEDYITELLKKAAPQAKPGWLSRTFWRREPEESPLDKLSAKDLLKELEDDRTADVEVVEPPQKLKVLLSGGQVLLDVEDDTGPALLRLLNMNLKTTTMAVKVDSATDHRGQSSADFRLDLGLGSVDISHHGNPFVQPKQQEADATLQQSLVLCLENRVQTTENLMKMSLTFAPVEIFMIRGLVASILGFWPGAPEVEKAAGTTKPKLVKKVKVEERASVAGPSTAEILREMVEENKTRAKELAQEVYNRIPDKISLEIKLASPTVHVPVASVGKALITLGELSLKSPEPCLFNNLHFQIDLNNTRISTVNLNNEHFDVVEPLPIKISMKYMEQKDRLAVDVAIEVGQLSLSASPESVNLLMGLPDAAVAMLTVPVQAEAEEIKIVEAVDAVKDPAKTFKQGAQRGSAVELLGEDFAALQRAEELQKKPMRTTVSMSFDDATFALSDSIMPLLRLKLEAMPPGLRLEVEPSHVDMKLEEASLGIEVLNPRHGDWEPFLERFDFGFTLNVTKTKSLTIYALGPLLVNVVPTPLHQILELLPLLLASLRPPSQDSADQSCTSTSTGGSAGSAKIRVMSLWGGQLEVHCTSGSKSISVPIQPTGSKWIALDQQISPLGLKYFQVGVRGSSTMSEPLWFEQNASVMIPGCEGDVVAQLLTPQPNHRLLLLAPAFRLHNCTDIPLAVRFHDKKTVDGSSPEVVQQLPAAVCDAALLGTAGLDELPAVEGTIEAIQNKELILPPNSICAVPAGSIGSTRKGPFTVVSLRPNASNFSAPLPLGREAVQGISCVDSGHRAVHFLVEAEVTGTRCAEKVKTLYIRPTLSLMNALPMGFLGLNLVGHGPVVVPALERLFSYDLSVQELRQGLTLTARLAEGPETSKESLSGEDVVENTGNVQGDEALMLKLKASSDGAAAALALECLGHGQLRFSCPLWLLDRSGLKDLSIQVDGQELPSHGGVTLLHEDCFETPCDFELRGGKGAAKHSMKMPPSFEAFLWKCSDDNFLALNLHMGSVLSSSVFGATCMELTLKPRLVLTNAWDQGLTVETRDRRHLQLAPGESRVMHFKVPDDTEDSKLLETCFRFQPPNCEWSGVVLCSDAAAGSTPFAVRRKDGETEVWSVDVAPLHGSMGISIRHGSDFVAINRLENVRMQVQPLSHRGELEGIFEVLSSDPVPIGWSTPFAGSRCRARVTVEGQVLPINLQRTGTYPVEAKGRHQGWLGESHVPLSLRVHRHGLVTELSLEDACSDASSSDAGGFDASLSLRVKLGRAGISLIEENATPRELFFFSLDMLRLEYLQDAVRDSEKITISISEVQAICQLPDRTDGLDKVNILDPSRLLHLPKTLLENQDFPAVVLANHSAGGKSFLQFQMMRQATSSRDLLISSAELDVDKLDFTLDERWFTPLQQWLQVAGRGSFEFGDSARDLLLAAGKPITEGYVAPDVPAVVQAESVNISAVNTTVWCSLQLKHLDFLPAYIRTALHVFSLSKNFTLDGVSLELPAKQLEPHRGSLQDYAAAILNDYTSSVLAHIASLLGKSSVLNLPKAPLKLGGATVALFSDSLTEITNFSMSKLRHLTMDEEFIERKNRAPKSQIQGAQQGFNAAGKTLMEGVGGMFDVVTKPIEGAKKDGIWGFGTGLVQGTLGTIVKPVAAIGTAFSEVTDGLASSSNQLNVNEDTQRRSNRRRLRLPRLLFGDLGEVRKFVDIEAQLLQRYGENLKGVCEVVPLERTGKSTPVVLLYSDKLAVAVATVAEDRKLTPLEMLEESLPVLPSVTKAKTLRGVTFASLKEVSMTGNELRLVVKNGSYKVDLAKAHLQTGAKEALVEGIRRAIGSKGQLQAHRTWAELRGILRSDEHAARVRDMKMAHETGLKLHPTEAALSDRGSARVRLLDVFEVERFTLGFGWGTCNWPTDGDLQWRWVAENGKKHPQVADTLKKAKAAQEKEPPCTLGGLYKEAGPWKVDVTKFTDADGWVYGMAWSQPEWSHEPGLNLLRRRHWTRPFH